MVDVREKFARLLFLPALYGGKKKSFTAAFLVVVVCLSEGRTCDVCYLVCMMSGFWDCV